jgi:hypothetical protein
MKKPVKLLLFLFISSLFLGILYYYNSPSNPNGGTTGISLTDGLRKQIDSFGKATYQDPLYAQIKRDVTGMNSAGELSDEEKDGLINSLELAKMKSLNLAFDEAKNANCMNVGALSKWSTQLQRQQKLVPNPEAQKRINAFGNLSAFLAHKGMVAGFLQGEFSQGRCDGLKGRISQLANSPGVRDCSACNGIQNDLLGQLERFQAAVNDYMGIMSGTLPCMPNVRDNFVDYPFYFENFNCPNE